MGKVAAGHLSCNKQKAFSCIVIEKCLGGGGLATPKTAFESQLAQGRRIKASTVSFFTLVCCVGENEAVRLIMLDYSDSATC